MVSLDILWLLVGIPVLIVVTWLLSYASGYKAGLSDEWHRVNWLFNDFFVLYGRNSSSVRWIYNAQYNKLSRLAPVEEFFPDEEKLSRNA